MGQYKDLLAVTVVVLGAMFGLYSQVQGSSADILRMEEILDEVQSNSNMNAQRLINKNLRLNDNASDTAELKASLNSLKTKVVVIREEVIRLEMKVVQLRTEVSTLQK